VVRRRRKKTIGAKEKLGGEDIVENRVSGVQGFVDAVDECARRRTCGGSRYGGEDRFSYHSSHRH